MKFYPHTLNQWLEEYDFSIVNASTVPDKELCGWMGAGYVEADGHIRGTVGWRHNGLHPKIVVRDFGNSSSAKALPRAYVPPQPTLRPGDKTIDTATSILRQNAPDADVYYFMTLMLGAACLTLGFAILFYGLIIYFEMDRRTREAGKKSADIELDQIKVHNLSGSGMQRMDSDIDDDDANTPRVNIEITKSHTSNSTSVSGTGSVADPPPIYTVDGMGR